MARKQWRCFHCDQVFYSSEQAERHFGHDGSKTPACKISGPDYHLIDYIRDLESQLENWRGEGHALFVAAYSLDCEARGVEREAEQRGYDKGVYETFDMLRKAPELLYPEQDGIPSKAPTKTENKTAQGGTV